MNEYSKEDDTVLICRSKTEDGDLKVEYYPKATEEVSMVMHTNGGQKWDERAMNYQRSRMKDGKLDRSRAGLYQ